MANGPHRDGEVAAQGIEIVARFTSAGLGQVQVASGDCAAARIADRQGHAEKMPAKRGICAVNTADTSYHLQARTQFLEVRHPAWADGETGAAQVVFEQVRRSPGEQGHTDTGIVQGQFIAEPSGSLGRFTVADHEYRMATVTTQYTELAGAVVAKGGAQWLLGECSQMGVSVVWRAWPSAVNAKVVATL